VVGEESQGGMEGLQHAHDHVVVYREELVTGGVETAGGRYSVTRIGD